jgi:hypothetical protein
MLRGTPTQAQSDPPKYNEEQQQRFLADTDTSTTAQQLAEAIALEASAKA